MSDKIRWNSAGDADDDTRDNDADEAPGGPAGRPWFLGRSPERRQLNRQFIFYGLVLLLVGLMLLAVKRLYGAP